MIERGWFILGPELEAFEAEFAAASRRGARRRRRHGTDALALALRALGIGPGDEVITSPLSAAFSGARDRDGRRDAGVRRHRSRSPDDRSGAPPRRRSRRGRRRSCPCTSTASRPTCRRFEAIARRHNLALVEDACQAHLATCAGRPVGTFGAAGAFSFYPTKNLGALGDGGAVVTNDAALAERLKRLRNGGQTDRYHHAEFGVNSRLDEMQAADPARAPAASLPAWTARRRALAARYRARSPARAVAVPPECDPGHVYHLFPVLRRRPRRVPGASDRAAASARSCTTRFRCRGSRRSRVAAAPRARSPIASAPRSARCRSIRGCSDADVRRRRRRRCRRIAAARGSLACPACNDPCESGGAARRLPAGRADLRLPVADRARRAALAAEERVFWHVMISVAWSLAVVLALGAARRVPLRTAADRQRDPRLARSSSRGRGGLLYRGCRQGRSVDGRAAARARRARRLAVLSAVRVHHRRQGSGHLHQRGHPDRRSAASIVIHDPVVAAVPPALATCSFRRTTSEPVLQRPVHGLLRRATRRPARSSASFRTASRPRSRSATASTACTGATAGRRRLWAILGLLARVFLRRRG